MLFSSDSGAQGVEGARTNAPVVKPATTELPKVEVSGRLTDNQLRQDFVAGKIVIGRRRIEDSGALNVAELLKREPAVSVTADGRIGLMGLPGYTQVLVNGAPPPPGKSLTEMDLMQVERIEIVKSSVAEFGPFGIAGTINVVTRKPSQQNVTQLRLDARTGAVGSDGGVSWSINQVDPGSPFSVNARVWLNHASTLDEQAIREFRVPGVGPPVAQVQGNLLGHNDTSMLSASATLLWKLSPQHTFEVEPSLDAFNTRNAGLDRYDWAIADAGPSSATAQNDSPLRDLSMPLKWTADWEQQGRLVVSFMPTVVWINKGMQRSDQFVVKNGEQRRSLSESRSGIYALKFDYAVNLADAHDVKVGATRSLIQEQGNFAFWLDGNPDFILQALGTRRDAVDRKLKAFVQDEWRISNQWAVNLGLSGEHREVNINEGEFGGHAGHSLWAPSAHLAWKLDSEGKRQLRFGMARTFKAPYLDELTTRPTINPIHPCASRTGCAANTVEYADRAGNPALKPERSLGVNVSYEHSVGDDSLVSIETYARQLDDVMGEDVRLESVPWSQVPRYVARPANLGTAWVRGLDLEARLQLRDFWKDGPKLNVAAGLNFARSRLSTLAGPDNHLADQTPWSAKLGGNYKLQELPLELSADAHWTPSVWTRTSAARRLYQDRRFNMSMQAAWTFSPTVRLRLVVDKLLMRDVQKLDEFSAPGETMNRETTKPSHARAGLRLEMKL